jgi:O-antigen ligase
MGNVNINKYYQLLGTIGLFLTLSSPSLKLIYSSPVINLLGPIFLLLLFFFKFDFLKIVLFYDFRFCLAIFFILFLFLFYFLFFEFSNIEYLTFFRYIYWVISLLLIVINSRYINVKLIINLILYWSITLAVLKILGMLNPSRELGQHYLTIGLPLGAGLTILLINFVNPREHNFARKLFNFFLFIIIIYALLISHGRSNLIYPFITLFIFAIFRFFFSSGKFKALSLIGLFFLIIFSVYYYIEINNIYFPFIERMSVLSSDESSYIRMNSWKRALELFQDHIFGLGIEAHQVLFLIYPHNIFIEVLFSFGILGGFILVYFLIVFFRLLIKTSISGENCKKNLNLGFLGLYFFISWNSSFDFVTSYIPFGTMFLFCLKSNFFNNKIK